MASQAPSSADDPEDAAQKKKDETQKEADEAALYIWFVCTDAC